MRQIHAEAAPSDMPAPETSVIVHSSEGWLSSVTEGAFDFFTKLESHALSHGFELWSVALDSRASKAAIDQGGRHLMIGGAARYQPGILHVAPAYLWGFWYMDEVGVHWQSSIRLADFPGDKIVWEEAEFFFNGVSGHMLQNNVSKADQRPRQGQGNAFATVFTQDIEAHWPRSHYLTTHEMIRNTARAAGGGLVYVKPHPYLSAEKRQKVVELCSRDPNLMVTDASVHDLIYASAAVVTQNSAAAFEGLMQHKPIVLCAKSDFYHGAATARSEEELRTILRDVRGQTRHVDYHRYFTWFLKHRCLEPQAEDFEARAWERIMGSVID
ncbi:MAG: hypothetical protein AAF330_07120 [Pseudomonadota bacterium]